MSNGTIDAKDVYEQIHRLAGAQDEIKDRVVEISDRIGRLPCGAHMERLEQLEKQADGRRPPSAEVPRTPIGSGYPAVMAQLNERLREVEETSHETRGDVTERIKLDAIAAAKTEAIMTFKQMEKEKEDAGDRKAIRWQRWLQLVSTVLAILGGSGIVASVRFMYSAEANMEKQVEATKKQRVIYVHQKADAAIEP